MHHTLKNAKLIYQQKIILSYKCLQNCGLVPRPKIILQQENGFINKLWLKAVIKLELNFKSTFAPVARLEAVKMLLTLASHMNFKLFQMDGKNKF